MNENKLSLFTSENPFLRDTKKKEFYYPSSKIEGPKDHVVLTSGISTESATAHLVETIEESLSNDPLKNIEEIMHEESGSSKFDESWPSTLQSFQETPVKHVSPPAVVKQKEHSVEDYIERHGTLSKFVQRFREQPPLPRQVREEKDVSNTASTPQFWWLQNGVSPSSMMSSTPSLNPNTDISTPSTPQLLGKAQQQKISMPQRRLSSCSDDVIGGMQSRADKLLEMSGNSVDHDTSTTLSHITSYQNKSNPPPSLPLQQHQYTIQTTDPWSAPKSSNDPPSYSRVSAKQAKPENDILYQWRLARKMEIAAESNVTKPLSHFRYKPLRNEKAETIDCSSEQRQIKEDIPNYRREPHDKEEKNKFTSHQLDPTHTTKEVATETENILNTNNQVKESDKQVHRKDLSCFQNEFLANNPHLRACVCEKTPQDYLPPCIVHPHVHAVCRGGLQQFNVCSSSRCQPTKVSAGVQAINDDVSQPCTDRAKQIIKNVSTEKRSSVSSIAIAQTRSCLVNKDKPYTTSTKPTISSDVLHNPVIKQVIAEHLFPDDETYVEEREVHTTPTPPSELRSPVEEQTMHRPKASTPTKVERTLKKDNTHVKKDSKKNLSSSKVELSDDEFVDDEILQDLRKKRKEIRSKLREIQFLLQLPSTT